MPNFKSITFKMAVLQGGGQNLPSPCVCYPKDPMWNRVKTLSKRIDFEALPLFVSNREFDRFLVVNFQFHLACQSYRPDKLI